MKLTVSLKHYRQLGVKVGLDLPSIALSAGRLAFAAKEIEKAADERPGDEKEIRKGTEKALDWMVDILEDLGERRLSDQVDNVRLSFKFAEIRLKDE